MAMISAVVRRPVIPEVKTLALDRDEDVLLEARQKVRFSGGVGLD